MADKQQKELIAEEYISSLRKRLEVLEQKLIGEEKVREGQPALLHLLKTMDRKLNVLSHPHHEVTSAWAKIPELEKFLDPGYVGDLKLSESAKEELLLSHADHLQKYQHDMDDLEALRGVLDDPAPFQGLEAEEGKLSEAAGTHVRQEQEVEELTGSVHRLVDTYTSFLLQMSVQCVKWDETISQGEGSDPR